MSAAKCLVSLMVVVMAALCVAHEQGRIKMCGRELIRLAVSSCGNSRLRRSILDTELGQPEHIPLWEQNSSVEEHQASERVRRPPQSDGQTGVFSVAPHWHRMSSRIRRNTKTISDICCEKGCSMKELIQFC